MKRPEHIFTRAARVAAFALAACILMHGAAAFAQTTSQSTTDSNGLTTNRSITPIP